MKKIDQTEEPTLKSNQIRESIGRETIKQIRDVIEERNFQTKEKSSKRSIQTKESIGRKNNQ
jgi:RNA polymerase-interacting CarD/CdnL/TRCF family regulator